MLASGLWHGAGLNYLVWGALHAFYLTVEKITHWPVSLEKTKFGRIFAILIVFMLTVVAWVFFRAQTFSHGVFIIQRLFSFDTADNWGVKEVKFNGIFFITLAVLLEILVGLFTRSLSKLKQPPLVKLFDIAQVGLLVVGCIFLRGTGEQFIYFQF
jgi:alginate O-acetyltransferase complex protein AlgI